MFKKNGIIKALPFIVIGLSCYSYNSFANNSMPSSKNAYYNSVKDSNEDDTGVLIEAPSSSTLLLDTDTVYTFKITNNRTQNKFKFSANDTLGFVVDVSPREVTLNKDESIEVKVTVNPGSDIKNIGATDNIILTTKLGDAEYAYYTHVVGTVADQTEPNDFSEFEITQGTLKSTGVAVTKKGDVYVWGYRGSSQQGNGKRSVSSKTPPTKVNSLSNIEYVVSGQYHLLALEKNGTVWGWGRSSKGQTGCSKSSSVPTPCKVMADVTQIVASATSSIALDKEGKVWTWGDNRYGQLGIGVKGSKSGSPNLVNINDETVRLIGATDTGAFAVTKEGHVWAWGNNGSSALGIESSKSGSKNIVPTPTHVINLDEYADRIVYIGGGKGWSEALLNDGQVIGWGLQSALGQNKIKDKTSSAEPIVIMSGVKQLFTRFNGSAALTDQNEIYTWGGRSSKSLQMIYGAVPTKRETVNKVVNIGGGKAHLFYETADGKIYGVGYNNYRKIESGEKAGKLINWPGQEIKLQED